MIEMALKTYADFKNKKVGDTPTDAYQLVPRDYFITGGPGSIIGANSSILTIDPHKGRLFKITMNSSVITTVVNASVAGLFGQQIQIIAVNGPASVRTLVFSSFFGASSLVGKQSSVATVSFVSDGTKFWEYARSQGL